MRKTYEFVSTDMDELDRLLVTGYEQFFGKTVMPGSPERLFISWVEDAIMYERAQNNWTGSQNLPSSAEGEYLDKHSATGTAAVWWLRSPYYLYTFCAVSSSGSLDYYAAYTAYGVVPGFVV